MIIRQALALCNSLAVKKIKGNIETLDSVRSDKRKYFCRNGHKAVSNLKEITVFFNQ